MERMPNLSSDGPLIEKDYADSLKTQVICRKGHNDMGDKGKRDKGKREKQKKAQLTPKEKRRLKKEKKNK
ncbi:MAG: hypothetical protein GWN67_13770 [Phycisphaerae bacterium]|nr:hypothetical protein [Phycisphaerae bacterium]NIV10564.1 hypothetical protein [Fodinibius sp.]NIP53179.1 hypothetical protein [Phycisphaerae bacterium]NIS52213.1 hypothetical protein [Phycisphaerae bacterium]NIU09737.1 hypothetical protein [Phycisphaerae bacterium]